MGERTLLPEVPGTDGTRTRRTAERGAGRRPESRPRGAAERLGLLLEPSSESEVRRAVRLQRRVTGTQDTHWPENRDQVEWRQLSVEEGVEGQRLSGGERKET